MALKDSEISAIIDQAITSLQEIKSEFTTTGKFSDKKKAIVDTGLDLAEAYIKSTPGNLDNIVSLPLISVVRNALKC